MFNKRNSLFFILYSLFFILYSLFFILYSLFFILYSLFKTQYISNLPFFKLNTTIDNLNSRPP